MPNVTARLKHQWDVLVGDDVTAVQPSQIQTMMRSTERTCITNMGNQMQVWKSLLEKLRISLPPSLLVKGDAAEAFGWKVSKQQSKEKSIYTPSTMAVVIMVSPLCPRTILEQILQVWFHDFGFAHVGLLTSQAFGDSSSLSLSSSLSSLSTLNTKCCTVVDLGWSASQVVPLFQGKILRHGIRRMPVGGRHLVGLYKYYCSYRQWNLMDADLLMEDVHQSLSYVSLKFKEELETAQRTYLSKRPFDREFVLPDYQTTHKGFVRLTPWLLKLEEQEEQQQREDAEEALLIKTTKQDPIKVEQQEKESASDKDQLETKHTQDIGDNEQETEDDDTVEESKVLDKDGDDLDEDVVDSDEETDDQRRTRLLRQKAEEDRRQRNLEAEQQVLLVSVERFTIPEVLFHPSDAQLGTFAGLPETICAAIAACPRMYQSALYGNIRLVGGTSKIPNLKERLERELRALTPTHYPLEIHVVPSSSGADPIDASWRNAKTWLQQTLFAEWSLSRSEFETNKDAWHRLLDNKFGKLV